MSKKDKDKTGYHYRKQGSINDENFLMLSDRLKTINDTITNEESVDLTEIVDELIDINNTLKEITLEIDFSDTNQNLNNITDAINNIPTKEEELEDILDQLKEVKENIETNSEEIKDAADKLETLAERLDTYIISFTEQLNDINNEITQLNADLTDIKNCIYPDYTQRSFLIDSTEDVTNQALTIEEDGFIWGWVKTDSVSGTPLIRLSYGTSGTSRYFCECHGATGTYRNLSSGLYPVKKGDLIYCTLITSNTDEGASRRLVFYPKSSL